MGRRLWKKGDTGVDREAGQRHRRACCCTAPPPWFICRCGCWLYCCCCATPRASAVQSYRTSNAPGSPMCASSGWHCKGSNWQLDDGRSGMWETKDLCRHQRAHIAAHSPCKQVPLVVVRDQAGVLQEQASSQQAAAAPVQALAHAFAQSGPQAGPPCSPCLPPRWPSAG